MAKSIDPSETDSEPGVGLMVLSGLTSKKTLAASAEPAAEAAARDPTATLE